MDSLTNFVVKFMTEKKLKGIEFSHIEPEFPKNGDVGLYLHIPFCKIPCPFCPYNRYPYNPKKESLYVNAVKKEIDLYRNILQDVKISTLYVGGGTPTVMMKGLAEILRYVRHSFEINGDICVESNPDDLHDTNLDLLLDCGVRRISIGVQSFNNRILKSIGRKSHDGNTALKAVKLALEKEFDCVNVDLMFSLPYQTPSDVKKDLETAVEIGADQITTYPLLLFPYTKTYRDVKNGKIKLPNGKMEKTMYNEIVDSLIDKGYEMCSVWSFAKKGVEKYGSVEREDYIGIGAGAMSVANQYSYSNTFAVDEYIKAVEKDLPIAIGTVSSKEQSMIHWFMMRLYELGFIKSEFVRRFGVNAEDALKRLIQFLRLLKVIEVDKDFVKVTDQGLYPVHSMTKTFLHTYISRICEECIKSPWPTDFLI